MYTSREKIEALLKRELTEAEEVVIDELIDSVKILIDSYTGRDYTNDLENLEESIRSYETDDNKYLYTDDLLSVSTIRFNGAEHSEGIILHPLNNGVSEYLSLETGLFPTDEIIEVEATYSSGLVPTLVSMVASQLVVNELQSGASNGVASKKLRDYSVTYRDWDKSRSELLSKLDVYRKLTL